MNEMKPSGMKTSYQLALERLEQKEGRPASLSDKQKKAMAESESQTRAKIAEVEIMAQKNLQAARMAGDAERMKQIEDLKVIDIAKIRARGEDEREQIRRSKK